MDSEDVTGERRAISLGYHPAAWELAGRADREASPVLAQDVGPVDRRPANGRVTDDRMKGSRKPDGRFARLAAGLKDRSGMDV